MFDTSIDTDITKNFRFMQLNETYRDEICNAISEHHAKNAKHYKMPRGKNNKQVSFGWVTGADTMSSSYNGSHIMQKGVADNFMVMLSSKLQQEIIQIYKRLAPDRKINLYSYKFISMHC